MSANLVVDLANTTQQVVSIQPLPLLSGVFLAVASGTVIGQSCDMINADTYCNLFAAGLSASGRLRIQVQTAPADVSGQYTDPTSGMAPNFLPGAFSSGGILWINSGTDNGILGPVISGQSIASGWMGGQGFIRNQRYVRANVLSEASSQYAGSLTVGFISQLRTTGSGAGFSYAPTSGVPTV